MKVAEKKPLRVASFNDISGFGRCSLTTVIPVLSVLGVQCCPVPTAVLSLHTGFDGFYFHDMTDSLSPYLQSWEDFGVDFSAVFSGFLGSRQQISLVLDFIKKHPNSLCIVDPVMGDGGKIYPTYTDEMCDEMKRLISHADAITPNVTEACRLTDTPYTSDELTSEQALELCKRLHATGAKSVVITGIVRGQQLINAVFEGNVLSELAFERSQDCFSGNGDLFASIVTALMVRGFSLEFSANSAGKFITEAISHTVKYGLPTSDGIAFEPLLYTLARDYGAE